MKQFSNVMICETADEFREFCENYAGELTLSQTRVNGKVLQHTASEKNIIVATYRP